MTFSQNSHSTSFENGGNVQGIPLRWDETEKPFQKKKKMKEEMKRRNYRVALPKFSAL